MKAPYQNTINNYSMCAIQIVEDEIYANGELIGVTKKLYEETVEKGKTYKDMLITAGIIEKEKTQEEINAELASTVKEAKKLIEDMKSAMAEKDAEINKLKSNQSNGSHNNNNGNNQNHGGKK